jgi:hypothetical protein
MFRLAPSRILYLALLVGSFVPSPVPAGNTTGTTRTQTYQPGEPYTGLPGGAPGRGYESGPSGLPSVYCQNWPGQSPYPQYPGTGPNTPCGPNFQKGTVAPPAGQAAVPPPGIPGPAQTATNMAELWKRRIDTYWSEQFRRKGALYRPPMLINVPGQLQYDPNTVTIEYDPAILNAILTDTGNFGLVIALAHEEGHNVQFLRGRYTRFMTAMDREHDADRLAGAYLAWAQQRGFLQRSDFGSAVMTVFQAGDTLPAFHAQAHGSPAERLHFMLQGYMNGPEPF